MPDDNEPLRPPDGDNAAAVFRAVSGSLPVVGTALGEALSFIIQAPLQQRVQSWREEVWQRIVLLEQRISDFSTKNLENDQDFASAVINAQMAVLRSNADERREALANAVLNVALGRAPDEDRQQMFLNYVAELTPSHLRLLAYLIDPLHAALWSSEVGASPRRELDDRNALIFKQHYDHWTQCQRDLAARGLVTAVDLDNIGVGVLDSRPTRAGEEFLQFVTAPVELNE